MGLSGISSDSWWANLLPAIHAPDTANNRSNLNAWQACEGGSAAFNPFNTTLWWPRSSCYNSVCVRNYASFQDGWSATAATINQSNMSDIRHALQRNLDRAAFADAIGRDPWGTSAACVRTASGGGSGGVPGPGGRIHGPGIPPAPPEHARDDWSARIHRSALQFRGAGNALNRYQHAIGHLVRK